MNINNNSPVVSIIIPVYNGSDYMREAIDSALAQSYKNIEVIVVNDGSNDDGETEKIALSYGDRIKYIRKENGGVSSALNTGINVMKGEYFSWLSHDDVYLPDKVQSQINAISKLSKEQRVVCLCESKQIDNNSNDLPMITGNKPFGKYADGEIINYKEALCLLIKQGSFNGCSFLIPKEAFLYCGGFNENMRYTQDFFMWIKLFLYGYNLLIISGVHVCSRVHGKQVTVTGKKYFHKDCLLMGNILLEDFASKSSKQYNYIKEFALYNAKYNNKAVVDKYIHAGKQYNLLSNNETLYIRFVAIYGVLRPFLRAVYYALMKFTTRIKRRM